MTNQTEEPCIPCEKKKIYSQQFKEKMVSVVNVAADTKAVFIGGGKLLAKNAGLIAVVGEDEYQRRLELCKKCHNLLNEYAILGTLPLKEVCGMCKCPIKNKALFQKEQCGMGKW